MSLPAAYLGVIVIWSTTPLAIQWSADGPGFLFGVTARMVIGVALAWGLIRMLRIRLPWHRRAVATYLVAGLGVFLAMTSVYWAAGFIPSGWLSVMFGLSPILTGLLAWLLLSERHLTAPKVAGMLLGLAGLAVIFVDGLHWRADAVYGLIGVLFSVLVHALSSVTIKRIDAGLPGLATMTGALTVAVPLFVVTWLLAGAVWPQRIEPRALGSIVYLGVFGSVLGFALYYFILQRLDATRVALLTLITPVIALLLGHFFNAEPLRPRIWWGAMLVALGLVLFEGRALWGIRPGRGREV